MRDDTIAAIATPPGKGGVGIVRISGPEAKSIATSMTGPLPPANQARLCQIRNSSGDMLDEGLVLYFKAPRSFTGEEVVELQTHGSPVVMDLLMREILQLGARVAEPGEFSRRAFLNDKIDLAQAEAIADLIDAGSEQAARAAQRSLQGQFSQQVNKLVNQLVELRMYVEAAIDFPEEEVDFLSDKKVLTGVDNILDQLSGITKVAEQGRIMHDGMNLVLTGLPNAGKSSLLNQLSGEDAAIVTDIPGTTRDVLTVNINLDGMPVRIVDTAGLRDSNDLVEKEGIRRAWKQIEQADRILLLVDDTAGISSEDNLIIQRFPASIPVTIIRNKIDINQREHQIDSSGERTVIYLSAKTGEGIQELREYLKREMGFESDQEGVFLARRRHLDAIARATDFVISGRNQLVENRAGELLADDLHQAQQALNEITGEFSSDDLLGKIFSSFCIGK